jgi:hypothetical protein
MIKEDKNTYSYQSYGYTLTGPICSIKGPYRRIRTLITESATKLEEEPAGTNVVEELNGKYYYYKLSYVDISSASSSVPSGEDVYYSVECSGVNGINAYLNPTDFTDNPNLQVQNVIVIKGINRTKAIIQVKAKYPAQNPGCISNTIVLKDTNYITDSIGNKAGTLNFPSVNICLVNETITN